MAETPNSVTKRSPVKLLVFTGITFGLYWLYYVHQVNKELKEASGASYSPGVRTLTFLIPFVNFYAVWQIGQTANEVTDDLSPGVAAIGLLVPLFGAFLMQPKFNEIA
ncbi:DUF4234 domain-containing protein [Halorussus gelatinilyticus]|uniref:DUF4234 domain-containing protein n=1 Tax=Halorussus gelatinilyticus TaxID=2937524 RepID=A0A8U0ILS7_9EURY|nr:DUF4234 domain-containing protein [Halorussus gelatinilyticus]UPW01708.1 DUF4234 domain-containing protein [Halorussus gelatinilyticus]